MNIHPSTAATLSPGAAPPSPRAGQGSLPAWIVILAGVSAALHVGKLPPAIPALQADLGLPGQAGAISSAMHRDDYAKRGLTASGQTTLPFEVDGADILLLDDVLYTGRTVRAVVNELFDYGRPARVRLAVLVDRGGRELPIQPAFAASRISLPPGQKLALGRTDDGRFTFAIEGGRA